MSLVHNERVKLTATWLNSLATALVTAGTFAPVLALVYGTPAFGISAWGVFALAGICLAGGVGLHMAARAVLGRLKP